MFQIFLNPTTTLLVITAVWLGQVQSITMDYRYKPRGPPRPPAPPPLPQYVKKWEHRLPLPNRNSNRPKRPLPMKHAHQIYPQQPMGPQLAQPSAPIRTVWKNPPLSINFPKLPEKTFQSSPSINRPTEYEYHVQTNNIPTHSIPIKQVGEKGPIHTIPAPNLSLADKPTGLDNVISTNIKLKQQNFAQPIQGSLQLHQYQVTEGNDLSKNPQNYINEQPFYFAPENLNAQSFNFDKALQTPQANKLAELEALKLQSPLDDGRLSQQSMFQIINSHIQKDLLQNQKQQHQQQQHQQLQHQQLQHQQQQHQQQHQLHQQQQQHPPQHHQQQQHQIYDNYDVSILPQSLAQHSYQQSQTIQLPQEMSLSEYQTLLGKPQIFQQEPTYLKQIQQMIDNQKVKDSNQFKLQSFNFERNAQNNFPLEEQASTFITTDYNLKTSESNSPLFHESRQTVSNLPFNQQIFTLSSDSGSAKVDSKLEISDRSGDEDDVAFYTTLPSRQAADTLASLQAAGQVHNNLRKISQQQNLEINSNTPLDIYVPDSQNYEIQQISVRQKKEESIPDTNQSQTQNNLEIEQEYDDSSSHDEVIDEQSNTEVENFGQSTKPKQI